MKVRLISANVAYKSLAPTRWGWWRRRLLRLAALILLPLTFLAIPPPQTGAQTSLQTYWRHTASRGVHHISPADINYDGVLEFLLAAENGRVDMLSSDGVPQWSYLAADSVAAITPFNLDGDAHPQLEVALIADNRLLILESSGELIADNPIRFIAPPTSLFTYSNTAAAQEWLGMYAPRIEKMLPFDYNADGQEELLVLLGSGQLHLFDPQGNAIWNYVAETTLLEDINPQIQIADFNQDGFSEIVLGAFHPRRRFSILEMIAADGQQMWDQAITGTITAISLIPFNESEPPRIAVGTDRGQIHLYSHQHRRLWWPRSLNKPITAITPMMVDDGAALVAGTEVGVVVAYLENGSRFWTRRLVPEANRPVLGISSAAGQMEDENEASLAVLLGPQAGIGSANDVQLLNINGRSLTLFAGQDSTSFSQLLDINRDGRSELLFSRFAIVELLGLGVGASETASEWEYSLDAAASSHLVVDFNRDGEEELLIGAQNGRLHYLNNRDNPEWIVAPGDDITHLALLERTATLNPVEHIVLVRNRVTAPINPSDEEIYRSWVELRQTNGDPLWEQLHDTRITSLLVENVNQRGDPEIIIGTQDGQIFIYSSGGTLLAQDQTTREDEPGRPIHFLKLIQGPTQTSDAPHLLAATDHTLFVVDVESTLAPTPIAYFEAPIKEIYTVNQPGGELALAMLLFTAEEIVGLNWRGIQMPAWPIPLNGRPLVTISANDIIEEAFEERTSAGFLFATDQHTINRISITDNEPQQNWVLPDIPDVSSLYWGDIDGDALPEIVVGMNNQTGGSVQLYSFQPQLLDEIILDSGVFGLTVLQRDNSNRSDLVIISENGNVQLFRAQENRPPLLTNPQTSVVEGQYSFTVEVNDVEGDQVTVGLQLRDANGFWRDYETQQVLSGNDRIFWQVANPPATNQGVEYRFTYDDGTYQSQLTPPAGPPPIPSGTTNSTNPLFIGLFVFIGGLATLLLVRQAQSPTAQARRFYRQLQRTPAATLPMIAQKYIITGGAQEFLLYLASQARRDGNDLVRSLADGLFLLGDRPYVALPIITTTLNEAQQASPPWTDIEHWQLVFNTGQALLEAPTITEISLLRPQLVEMLDQLEKTDRWLPVLNALLPIMTNLRDSERVEQADDRLVYLNEASYALNEFLQNLSEFSVRIERTLAAAIVRRWSGLVSAAAEELRGRAELVVQLKTRRMVPDETMEIVIECHNNGRAPAENIIAVLEEEPSYLVQSEPQVISFLPPGRRRQLNFKIIPQVSDRFRALFTLSYDDRSEMNRRLKFGDMVHILQPQREFTPITNPYLPGTPLRRKSTMFYGREQLFNFIADNAGGWSQRNVLILIGQRRTGKTSALLRLEKHLPDYLLPVYIDCQSLGVVPGMPALFHDLAWLISDALALRDIELEVPEMETWEHNPTVQFQREFLPRVKSLLTEDTTLLLVFDEFEAFENLVNDAILPPTFFSFMRHLMQHSEGLSFIFVGTQRLEDMSADYWSVLFNIALYERIGYLSEEAATHLISDPVAPNIVYDDLAIDKILRVTAGHPYFLQLVCYTLVNRANKRQVGYVTISDVNAGLEEMLSLGEVHFAYLWQRSMQTERALLTAVAHMMDRDRPLHPEDFASFLATYGIHLHPSDVTAALNRLVEREIMREVRDGITTLYELKIGLVGLWTARHKSLSKLYETTSSAPPANGQQQSRKRNRGKNEAA